MKKILLLLLALLIGFGISSSASEYRESEEIISELKTLGVIGEATNISDSETLTRGKFISLALGLMNRGTKAENEEAYAEDASLAAAYGIISNSGGGFRLYDNLKYDEAVKILVNVLGFGDIAEHMGGYPDGYIRMAARLKLTGVKAKSENENVTGRLCLELFENALDIDINQSEKITSGGTVEYKQYENETLLTEYFDIYRTEGVLDANRYTDLHSAAPDLSEGDIRIDGKAYISAVPDTDALNYLGYNVKVYYRQVKGGDKRIILMRPKNNDVITVKAEDFVSADKNVLRGSAENGKQRDFNIRNSVCIINGKLASVTELTELSAPGFIYAIDNNRDGIYDVLQVRKFSTYVVENVSADIKKINDKISGKTVSFDDEGSKTDTFYFRDFEQTEESGIGKGDVLTVCESKGEGRRVRLIYISAGKAEGFINAVEEDKITVEDEVYTVIAGNANTFKVGASGTFYVDAFGNIVYADLLNRKVYAYLYAAEAKGIGAEVKLKLFSEYDRWVELNAADRVKLNGKKIPKDEFFGQISRNGIRQMVTYAVNADAEVIELNTAQSFEKNSAEEEAAVFNNTFRLSDTFSGAYRSVARSLDNYVSFGENTKIFWVQSGANADEDLFRVSTYSGLADAKEYTVKCYDLDQSLVAGICCIENSRSYATSETSLIVRKIKRAANSDGEDVYLIDGFYGGTDVAFMTESTQTVDGKGGISVCDVLKPDFNEDGELYSFQKNYDAANGFSQMFDPSAGYSSYAYAAGRVVNVSDESIVIRTEEDIANGIFRDRVYRLSKSYLKSVYLVEPNEAKSPCSVSSVGEIMEGDYVYMTMNYYRATEIAIFRK